MERSRNFALELYPEDSHHCQVLNYIMNFYDYAYILHDKDTFPEEILDKEGNILHTIGELKKPHWHVIISFKNARSSKKLLEELNIKHIETCNFYLYCRYLIHKDNPKKYQYKKEDIVTNIKNRVDRAFEFDINYQEEQTRFLLDYIFSTSKESYLTFRNLIEYAMQNDCLLEVKKNTYFYKQFCDDTGFRRY